MPGQSKVFQEGSSCTRMDTPPDSPELLPDQVLTMDHFQQFLRLLKKAAEKSEPPPPPRHSVDLSDDEGTRASRLEFKAIDEIWDSKTSQYRMVESSKPDFENSELDRYVFVVRVRSGKKNETQTVFIDIKSQWLGELIRAVLRNVDGVSMKDDRPSVERNVLYHFLPELEAHAKSTAPQESAFLAHLDLLPAYLKDTYASVTQRLIPLLANREITFDLLWALFKPSTAVFGRCLGTDKPRCIKYSFGQQKSTKSGQEYFHIEGQYFDFNGPQLGKATTALGICKFPGAKLINSLDAFPLEYHENVDTERENLISNGQKFVKLGVIHHRHYLGNAFRWERGEAVKTFIKGRIIIDPVLFQEMNPNYERPRIDKLKANEPPPPPVASIDWFPLGAISPRNDEIPVKINQEEASDLREDDVLFCSPTVLGYSLDKKKWLEFAVADITCIEWNPEPFKQLVIEQKKKKALQALVTHHTQGRDRTFDDFVPGKGRGLVILLHGPPGVGKTLTAEGLSEYIRKPLYTVSSFELRADPKKIEEQLTTIFHQAHRWKAVLLLDEADVFLRKRSSYRADEDDITAFLRKLEYNEGIIFLTTNRLNDFDEAMESRIHLPLRYPQLGLDTRKELWKSFLEKAVTHKGGAKLKQGELDRLAEKGLNGRQIKNTVQLGYALASEDNTVVSFSHLQMVLEWGKEFHNDFRGHGAVENLRSYT